MINDQNIKPLAPLFGQDANTILLEVMDTNIRNEDIEEKLNKLENELPIDNLELASND